jgi:glycosyltransferase involved in cell wall biosynthesis
MQIVVDGFIYEQQLHGGIPRIFSEILPRMCELEPALSVALLTLKLSQQQKQALPIHARIHHQSLFPPARLFRRRRLWWRVSPSIHALAQRFALRNDRTALWHSTYYTALNGWTGPVVTTVADMIYERFTSLFVGPMNDQIRRQKRDSIQRADAILCISETTKAELLKYYHVDKTKVYVTPLAYNNTMFYPRPASSSIIPPPFLLYIGGRTHYKNFTGLLKAYSVWDSRKEVRLVVVGSSWAKAEAQLLAELGIERQVQLLTRVDDLTLSQLYNQAAAFVYPSLYEGFGIPLLEALACGCPVIASRIPSSVEIAGECPIYFDPVQQDGLLVALDTALTTGREAERVRLGLDHVKSYSWDRTAQQTLAVYRALSTNQG